MVIVAVVVWSTAAGAQEPATRADETPYDAKRLANDRVLIGMLLQQVFGQIDTSRPNTVFANDLVINPFLTVQPGKGAYI